MIPKGFQKDIKVTKSKIGFERRQEILDNISYKGTFMPRTIGYEDIDKSTINFIEEDLSITIDGEKVPVIFLTLQRWNEFSETWKHSDEYKDMKIPFITIVRQPNPQYGTNYNGMFNIPGRKTYTYYKVPTFENGRKGVDLYKIPQPTSVDLIYEVRLFCNRMKDLNKLNELVQITFNARQSYINVLGHPMPLVLEEISDESSIEDFENRRFYVQPYTFKLLGYIQRKEDFEVVPTLNRQVLATEIVEHKKGVAKLKSILDKFNNIIKYNFIFKKGSIEEYNVNEFSFKNSFNLNSFKIVNMVNINNITIEIDNNIIFNGVEINNNFQIPKNSIVKITIIRNNNNENSGFTLINRILK